VQQALISRQLAVGEFFPLTGRAHLVGHAFQTALLSPASRVIVCGGEERGTWLLEQKAASDRTFAFAISLVREREGAIGHVEINVVPPELPTRDFTLPELHDLLAARRMLDLVAAPGIGLKVSWL
jgi:hypothetical protein